MSFVEDGPAIFPFNSTELSITDEDNVFILRATMKIENSASLPANVSDELVASSTDAFRVSGSGNTTLVVEAIGPSRYITTHQQLVDYLRENVAFMTNDQAPYIVRNLSIVVEEFPLGEAALSFTYIPIYVIPVNDQPILNSTQVEGAILMDYLPETENIGFNTSFLLSLSDLQDSDMRSPSSQDFIGLAITAQRVPPCLGAWQYRVGSDWIDFPPDLSLCNPLLVGPSTRIRFFPSPNYDKADGIADFTFHAWDGSSDNDSLCYSPTDRGMTVS